MERFTSLFLMLFLCSGCEAADVHEIVPDRTIWLGESVNLSISIPNMKRPIVWQGNNHRYECHYTCADSSYFKVTQYNDTSILWIATVLWEFSKWYVRDYNLEFGEIKLDINVKPKIEIKITNTEYILMANCSLPFTTINCYQGKKLLKFTNVSHSNCSDGRTFSNIRTLRYSDFSGSVVCWFTIGKIFMEYRLLHFESENSFRRHLTDEPLRLIASITFFTALIAVGYFLFGKLRSRMKILTRGNGKDSTHRNFTTEILLRGLYFALIIATIFPLVIPCQMRIEKHLKYKQDEDTFISICIVAIIFGIFSIPLFFAWLIAFYKLYKMGQQMETVTGEDSQQRNRNSAIVLLYVPLPEFIVMIVALIFSCRKCEQGAGCPTCLLASVVSILLLSIALFYRLKKRNQIPKWERAKKYLIDICVVTIRLLEGIFMLIAVPFLWIRSRLQTMSQRLTRKKVTEREFRDPEVNPLSNEDPGHL